MKRTAQTVGYISAYADKLIFCSPVVNSTIPSVAKNIKLKYNNIIYIYIGFVKFREIYLHHIFLKFTELFHFLCVLQTNDFFWRKL